MKSFYKTFSVLILNNVNLVILIIIKILKVALLKNLSETINICSNECPEYCFLFLLY